MKKLGKFEFKKLNEKQLSILNGGGNHYTRTDTATTSSKGEDSDVGGKDSDVIGGQA